MTKDKIIIKPLITEKTTRGVEKENKYCFLVSLECNKIEIKNEIQKIYKGISVEDVNTIVCRPEYKSRYLKSRGLTKFKTTKYKKAIIKLKEGDSIDIHNNNLD